MKAEDIKSIEDLEEYIETYREDIYIREQINGKWGAYNLNEMPAELAEQHIQRFLNSGRIPVRILREKLD